MFYECDESEEREWSIYRGELNYFKPHQSQEEYLGLKRNSSLITNPLFSTY